MPTEACETTFTELRRILERHSKTMLVQVDTRGEYQVALPARKDRAGRPLFAAAVQIKKNYVSYHLMGLYAVPNLVKGMSPGLKRRMQGKSCFNFTTIEGTQAKELSTLTKNSLLALNSAALPWEQSENSKSPRSTRRATIQKTRT